MGIASSIKIYIILLCNIYIQLIVLPKVLYFLLDCTGIKRNCYIKFDICNYAYLIIKQ